MVEKATIHIDKALHIEVKRLVADRVGGIATYIEDLIRADLQKMEVKSENY